MSVFMWTLINMLNGYLSSKCALHMPLNESEMTEEKKNNKKANINQLRA